jgi:hypothetical protein
MNRAKTIWCLVVGLALAGGAAVWFRTGPPRSDDPVASGPPWFADVTAKLGIDFVHDAGSGGKHFTPEAIGSGVALFDFDNDGRLDLYFLTNGGPKSSSTNKLYQQRADGTFADVSAGSGLDIPGHNMGVAVADVNNDGWRDVLVTQYTGVRLFLNQDGKRFLDVTGAARLANPAWGASAAFLDYDRDGWLDLVLVNYVDYDPTWPCTTRSGVPDYCPPSAFPGRVSKLFRNLGAVVAQDSVPVQTGEERNAAGQERNPVPRKGGARFEDVTVPAGLGTTPGPGLGVVCADFDGDGWPDIFVANDGKPNRLWINQKNGTFVDEAVSRGVSVNIMGKIEAGMGVALGDADGDGLFDLFVTHLTEETNTLWRQHPRGLFTDLTARRKVAATRWRGTGFGAVFADFDHDGALDIAIANGRVSKPTASARPELGPHWGWYAERNQVLANDGAGSFRDFSDANPDLCGTPNVARGLAMGDIDNDGALDLVVTTIAGPAKVYRNIAEPRGRWLTIRVVDTKGNRDALGAEVRIHAGERRWLRLVQPACSYLSSSDDRVHLGLGNATNVQRIEVTWPDGGREVFAGGDVDRHLVLRRGDGEPD